MSAPVSGGDKWINYDHMTHTYRTRDGTCIAAEVADEVQCIADVLLIAIARKKQRFEKVLEVSSGAAQVPGLSGIKDGFQGDNEKLVECIGSLLRLDEKGALVPHGIGGFARDLLSAAAVRIAALSRQGADK